MSYETDLKIQNCLRKNVRVPPQYFSNVNFYKTDSDPISCAETEARILGKVLSKKQRAIVIAKINYLKRAVITKLTYQETESELTVELDNFFNEYRNGFITAKDFGEKVKELKQKEILNA